MADGILRLRAADGNKVQATEKKEKRADDL